MSISTTYACTCAVCGAEKSGAAEVFANTDWHKTTVDGQCLDAYAWQQYGYGDDCVCPDCYAKYKVLRDAADAADEAARKALVKQDKGGGSGTEADPYVFVPNTLLTLAAFYCEQSGGDAYAYMPADGTAKTYTSWADALPDMVRF